MAVNRLSAQDAVLTVASTFTPSMPLNTYSPATLGVLWVLHDSTTASVSSLQWDTNNNPQPASFGVRREVQMRSAAQTLEMWTLWGVGMGGPANTGQQIRVQMSGSVTAALRLLLFETDAVQDGSHSIAISSTSSGNGTAVTTGVVTPKLGDLLVASGGWAQTTTTAPSATMDAPGGSQGMAAGSSLNLAGTLRSEAAYRLGASSVDAHSRSWTLPAAREWLGSLAAITPAVSPAMTATATYKGYLTRAADQAAP